MLRRPRRDHGWLAVYAVAAAAVAIAAAVFFHGGQMTQYANRAATLALGQIEPPSDIGWQIGDDATSLSMRRLHNLASGLLRYSADHGRVLPNLADQPALWQRILRTPAGDEKAFTDPLTGSRFGINTGISGRRLSSFPDRSAVVVLYEDRPATDGTRGVAFLDGQIRRVREAQWKTLAEVSNLR